MSTSHPLVRRSAAEQRKFQDAMRELWEQRISFNKLLGLKVVSLDPADVRLRLDMRPELVGHHASGRLHGGVISASLDALGGMALMVALSEKHHDESAEQVMHRFGRMGTIDLRVDFLRQGIGQ
ncbi:MAG: thioesterase family protein, partial [Rubrivivax sp.]